MVRIVVSLDALADLDALWETESDAAADLEVFLEEVADDQVLLQALFSHQRKEGRMHVSRLLKYEIWGQSVWRIKLWEIGDPTTLFPYRIIYAVLGDVAHILAIMHRDQEYEKDVQLVTRIRAECRRLGIA